MKKYLLAVSVFLMPSLALAAPSLPVDSGLIKASSPLHGLDVAADRLLMGTPLVGVGGVVHERASEAYIAAKRNHTKALIEVQEQLNKTLDEANQRHVKGLEKAATVLNATMEKTPIEASTGLTTALKHVKMAQRRKPPKKGLLSKVPFMSEGNKTGQRRPGKPGENQSGREVAGKNKSSGMIPEIGGR